LSQCAKYKKQKSARAQRPIASEQTKSARY
jgi:hypothetical protein